MKNIQKFYEHFLLNEEWDDVGDQIRYNKREFDRNDKSYKDDKEISFFINKYKKYNDADIITMADKVRNNSEYLALAHIAHERGLAIDGISSIDIKDEVPVKDYSYMKKLSELKSSTYDSVMKKVGDRSDPRSFRLYNDAKKLKYREFLNTTIKVQLPNNVELNDFKIGDIRIVDGTLELANANNITDDWKREFKKRFITFNTVPKDNRFLLLTGSKIQPIKCYVDRRGANIISKILGLNGIEVRPQEIPQF